MTGKDIPQLLVQLKVLLERRKSGCNEQQDSNTADQITEYLYSHFVRDFLRKSRERGLNNEEFEEIYQETFWRIVKGIHTYDETRGGSGWVATIFENSYKDFLEIRERRRNRETSISDTDEPSSNMADPANIVEEEERIRSLNLAWQETTEAEREALRNRGRGPGRKEWHAAVACLRKRFLKYYSH